MHDKSNLKVIWNLDLDRGQVLPVRNVLVTMCMYYIVFYISRHALHKCYKVPRADCTAADCTESPGSSVPD